MTLAVGSPVAPLRAYPSKTGAVVDARGRQSGRGYIVEPLPEDPTAITLTFWQAHTSTLAEQVVTELVYSVRVWDVGLEAYAVEQYPISQLLTGALVDPAVPRANVATFDGEAPTTELAELAAAYRGVTP